jgi:hypothetical protein
MYDIIQKSTGDNLLKILNGKLVKQQKLSHKISWPVRQVPGLNYFSLGLVQINQPLIFVTDMYLYIPYIIQV